jgi:hypothetical protein
MTRSSDQKSGVNPQIYPSFVLDKSGIKLGFNFTSMIITPNGKQ